MGGVREAGAPLGLTVIRRGSKEQSTPVFPTWAGLECGKASSLHLHQLGASSQLKLPLRFEIYKSGVSFGFIDPGHGTKQ